MSHPVLEITNLQVNFPSLTGAVPAVKDCSLSVAPGEVLGLVGESGSGKSMTALACLGLVPPPGRAAGEIILAGRDVMAAGENELAALRGGTAAMIFQNPSSALNPFFKVGDQMADVIRRHRSLSRSAALRLAQDALAETRIADPGLALEKYPHQMSGGQLQRVVIAMALACEPKLLIADEPTTALDVTIQAQILNLLRDLVKSEGLAVLFITHDLGVVASICDRVAVMYCGAIVESAEVNVLFERPAHPYSRMLLETVPDLTRAPDRLTFIPGQVPDPARPPSGCAFHPRCPSADALCSDQAPPHVPLLDGGSVVCHHHHGGATKTHAQGYLGEAHLR